MPIGRCALGQLARRRERAPRRRPAQGPETVTRSMKMVSVGRWEERVRGVGVGARERLDRPGDVQAAGHAAEAGVVVRQARGVARDDEELGAVGVRAGVRHRDRAGRVAVARQLVVEGVAGAAAAGALGVAALDDEVPHDAVEGEPVVEALAGEEDEVVDGDRRAPRLEGDRDVAAARPQRGRVARRRVDRLGRRAGVGLGVGPLGRGGAVADGAGRRGDRDRRGAAALTARAAAAGRRRRQRGREGQRAGEPAEPGPRAAHQAGTGGCDCAGRARSSSRRRK